MYKVLTTSHDYHLSTATIPTILFSTPATWRKDIQLMKDLCRELKQPLGSLIRKMQCYFRFNEDGVHPKALTND